MKAAILRFPPFANLDHARVVRDAVAVYENETGVKAAILKYPQFAGLDHARVIQDAVAVYENEAGVKVAILKFPQFASLGHARVVRDAVAVYEDETGVKAAILKVPAFASLDHARVIRDATRLGKYISFSKQEITEVLLKNPLFAGYSARRYIAGLDVARALYQEGFAWNETMQKAYFLNISKSPYVPGTLKQRVSHVAQYTEPPLLIAMRKYLMRHTPPSI